MKAKANKNEIVQRAGMDLEEATIVDHMIKGVIAQDHPRQAEEATTIDTALPGPLAAISAPLVGTLGTITLIKTILVLLPLRHHQLTTIKTIQVFLHLRHSNHLRPYGHQH